MSKSLDAIERAAIAELVSELRKRTEAEVAQLKRDRAVLRSKANRRHVPAEGETHSRNLVDEAVGASSFGKRGRAEAA